MFRNRKKILSLVIIVFFLGVFIWYISSNWKQFEEISLYNPLFLVPAVALIAVNIFCQGMLLDLAVEPHGIKLSKKEVFGLSSITRFGNYISTAYGGTTLRAVYLKKTYGVSYTKFSSSFILSNVLQLVYTGFLAIFIYFVESGSVDNSRVVYVFLFSLIFLLIVLVFPVRFPKRLLERVMSKYSNKIFKLAYTALTEYGKVRRYPHMLSKIFFWLIIAVLSSATVLWLIYKSLGADVSLLPVMFISILGAWAIIFSLTPANIGISESLFVIGANLMGISIPITLIAAIVLRALIFSTVSLLSLYLAPKLLDTTFQKLKNIKNDPV